MRKINLNLIMTFILIFMLTIVSGCGNTADDKCEGDTCTFENEDNTGQEEISADKSEDINKGTETTEGSREKLSADIQKIKDGITKITAYEFNDHENNQVVFVKGDKRVIVVDDYNTYKVDDFRYNTIFMDYSTQKAYGACMDWSQFNNDCAFDRDTYKEIDFRTVKPVDPFKELKELDNGEIVRKINCGNKDCHEIKYTKDGKDYSMLVRTYYPMPYQITEFDEEGTVVEKIMYDDAAFNHIKDAEMEIPKDFELIE